MKAETNQPRIATVKIFEVTFQAKIWPSELNNCIIVQPIDADVVRWLGQQKTFVATKDAIVS